MTSMLFFNLHPLGLALGEPFFPLKVNANPVGVHQGVLGTNLRSHRSRTTETSPVASLLLGGSGPGQPLPDFRTLIYTGRLHLPLPNTPTGQFQRFPVRPLHNSWGTRLLLGTHTHFACLCWVPLPLQNHRCITPCLSLANIVFHITTPPRPLLSCFYSEYLLKIRALLEKR